MFALPYISKRVSHAWTSIELDSVRVTFLHHVFFFWFLCILAHLTMWHRRVFGLKSSSSLTEASVSPSSNQASRQTFIIILPQNTNNDKKQDSHTKANKGGEEAQKETTGLIDIGLPQRKKIKLTVRPGSKVNYNEGKYRLPNYIN